VIQIHYVNTFSNKNNTLNIKQLIITEINNSAIKKTQVATDNGYPRSASA
jgi:hypothetical protein